MKYTDDINAIRQCLIEDNITPTGKMRRPDASSERRRPMFGCVAMRRHCASMSSSTLSAACGLSVAI